MILGEPHGGEAQRWNDRNVCVASRHQCQGAAAWQGHSGRRGEKREWEKMMDGWTDGLTVTVGIQKVPLPCLSLLLGCLTASGSLMFCTSATLFAVQKVILELRTMSWYLSHLLPHLLHLFPFALSPLLFIFLSASCQHWHGATQALIASWRMQQQRGTLVNIETGWKRSTEGK